MTKLHMLTSSMVAIAGVLALSNAQAVPTEHPGTFCVPATSNSSSVKYTQYGIQNTSTTTALSVHCPGPDYEHNWLTNGATSVWVYDRTPAANDLCCTSLVLGADGSTISQSAQVCAPQSGGAVQTLNFSQHGGYGAVDVSCTIPPKDATNGASFVTTFVTGSGEDGSGHVTVVSGLQCTPQANEASNAAYNHYGIYNSSTTATLGVQCGGPEYSGGNIANVSMTVYDRTLAANDHCCTARVMATDGNVVATDGPKCAPNFGSAAQTITYNITGAGVLDFMCTIPKKDATNGASFVASYQYDNY